jgi:hypothetical protein
LNSFSETKEEHEMIIELHDADIQNAAQGTLAAKIGKDGTVSYTYQAEIWVQEALGDAESVRAVLISSGTVLAVWRKDGDKTVFEFKSPHYRGEWQLPVDHENCSTLYFTAEADADGVALVESWVTDQIEDNECRYAIVVRDGGVLGIWRRNEDGQIDLLARHPAFACTLGVTQPH